MIVGFVTPQSYGAIADGVADDSDAFEACCNSGQPILLLGKVRVTRNIVVRLNRRMGPLGLSIHGMGEQGSQIYLDAASAALTVHVSYSGSRADANTQVVLRDFNISPRVANQGGRDFGALNLIGTPNIGSVAGNYRIDNVSVVSRAGAYPNVGMLLKDVRNGAVTNCHIEGAVGVGSGIVFTSSNNGAVGNAPVDVNFDANHVTGFNACFELRPSADTAQSRSNEWQGVHITHNTMLIGNYGVYALSTEDTSAGLFVTGNIINANMVGVSTFNVKGCTITGNDLQANGAGATCVAVSMNVGLAVPDYCRSMIANNRMIGAGFPDVIAVQTIGAIYSHNMVTDNLAQGCNGGFQIYGANDRDVNNYAF